MNMNINKVAENIVVVAQMVLNATYMFDAVKTD
jgi:hypothetical protein